MKKSLTAARLFLLHAALLCALSMAADTVELFSYSLPGGKSGLRLAWREDSLSSWNSIGDGYNFITSDYGVWGRLKKMVSPRLIQNVGGGWVCIWTPDPEGGVTAVAYSPNLCKWSTQSYFSSATDIPRDIIPSVSAIPDSIHIQGIKIGGYRQLVNRSTIDELNRYTTERMRLKAIHSEVCADDSTRYASLSAPVKIKVIPDLSAKKPITDKLIGIFFEDINYGADGGLYAELVQNRDFEYTKYNDEHRGNDWNSMTAWHFTGDGNSSILNVSPIHANNAHYLRLCSGPNGASLVNEGFDGISVSKGEKYNLSIFMRCPKKQNIEACLVNSCGQGFTLLRLVRLEKI